MSITHDIDELSRQSTKLRVVTKVSTNSKNVTNQMFAHNLSFLKFEKTINEYSLQTCLSQHELC